MKSIVVLTILFLLRISFLFALDTSSAVTSAASAATTAKTTTSTGAAVNDINHFNQESATATTTTKSSFKQQTHKRKHHRLLRENSLCVSSPDDLGSAIDDLKGFSPSPGIQQPLKTIDIIADTLKINGTNPINRRFGYINITNQTVLINCAIVGGGCKINAQNLSRHFYIINSNVTFQGIQFLNGYSNNTIITKTNNRNISTEYGGGGGSMYIESSVIQFIQCEFINNTAVIGGGGGISAYNSTVQFVNGTFEGNYAQTYGAAMNIWYSNVTLQNMSTSKNIAQDGTVAIWETRINLNKVSFNDSLTNYDLLVNVIQENVDMTMEWRNSGINLPDALPPQKPPPQNNKTITSTSISAWEVDTPTSITAWEVDANMQRSSRCIATRAPVPDQLRIPTPVPRQTPPMPAVSPIPIPTSAPQQTPPMPTSTPQQTRSMPTSAPKETPPIPTPSRHHCFSGQNHVEVKGIGSIVLDQLRIGDYVKSGDGTFTQVYGFGHYDHHREVAYLRVFFHDTRAFRDNNNINATLLLLSPLEISPGHLIMLDRKNKRYPIRASDVRVGDILSGKIVKYIDTVYRRGVYAPLTQSGDITVNNIVASNYIDLLDIDYSYINNMKDNWSISLLWNQHVMGHILVTPQRVYCSYYIEDCKKEGYINGYGYLAYAIVQCATMLRPIMDFIGNIIIIMSSGTTSFRMMLSV